MGPYILRMVCLLRVALTRIASRGHPVVLERIGAGTAWGLCGARVHRIYPKSLLWGGPPLLVLGALARVTARSSEGMVNSCAMCGGVATSFGAG